MYPSESPKKWPKFYSGDHIKINDHFRYFGPPWRALQQGSGQILLTEHGMRLLTVAASHSRYSNAQFDDYTNLRRTELPWKPPLRLHLTARFPTPIHGTAGFGFWNSPISPLGSWPELPAVAWFLFTSSPSNITPDLSTPGHGWKASTLALNTRSAWAWAPAAPFVFLNARFPSLHAHLWPRIQRALRVAERDLGTPDPEWRDYCIEWQTDHIRFLIDGTSVLEHDQAPTGPLGFVAWIDTQWMVATPRGEFGWGLLDVPEAQYIDIRQIQIEG